MTALSKHQLEILCALSKGPRVERARVDFRDWQDLEDHGLIARQNVNVSEMYCEITEQGRAELAKHVE